MVILALVVLAVAVIAVPRLIHTGARPRFLDKAVSAARGATPPTATPPTASPPTASAPPSSPAPTGTVPAYELQVVTIVNAVRLGAGCPAVRLDDRLAAAALEHTRDMAGHDLLSHLGSDGSSAASRIDQAGYFGQLTAENIARGYATPKAVMAAWMASAEHRANIVNCRLLLIGVGYVARGSWWTETFGG